jgi:hypothetical protein
MEDEDIEHHLIKGLYELDLVKDEYLFRKNKRMADIIARNIETILKHHPKVAIRWIKESKKWKL